MYYLEFREVHMKGIKIFSLLVVISVLVIAFTAPTSVEAEPTSETITEVIHNVETQEFIQAKAVTAAEEEEEITEEPEETTEEMIPLPPVTVTLSAAGDFTLGGDIQSGGDWRFTSAFEEHGADWFLANVKDIFEADDLTIVNLEGTLTAANTRRANRSFLFRGDPEYIDILTAGSVEVVNVANNHHNDLLSQGKADTLDTVKNADIGYFGYDDEYSTEIEGVTFGFLGFTEWDHTVDNITERIKAAKNTYDVVVVSFHWGIERQYTPSATQTTLGHAAVDAGADLVIGSHTHVLGEVENYNGVNIVYSLGNFCYGGHSNPADKDTMIFQQDFTIYPDKTFEIADSRVIPCSISSVEYTNNYQPTPEI
jgi:poly-gamma-glutamate synthesis protein (capsule biosynthesis protein)